MSGLIGHRYCISMAGMGGKGMTAGSEAPLGTVLGGNIGIITRVSRVSNAFFDHVSISFSGCA